MKLEKALLNCEIKKTGENEYEFIMSDETIDRDGEVIRVEGWDLKHFKKNNILLWGHRHDIPGIGVVGRVAKEAGNLVAKKVRFASPGIYELADVVHGLVDDNILKATSVGYIPKDREFPTEGENEADAKKPRVITNKAELYELSIVNVGSNPNALRAVKSAEDEAVKIFTGDEKQFLVEQKKESKVKDSTAEEDDLLLEMKDTLDNLCEKVDHIESLLQTKQKPGKYDDLLAGTLPVEKPADKQKANPFKPGEKQNTFKE